MILTHKIHKYFDNQPARIGLNIDIRSDNMNRIDELEAIEHIVKKGLNGPVGLNSEKSSARDNHNNYLPDGKLPIHVVRRSDQS